MGKQHKDQEPKRRLTKLKKRMSWFQNTSAGPPVPGTPTLSLIVDGASDISLTVGPVAPVGSVYYIEVSVDGGAWQAAWQSAAEYSYETAQVDLELHSYRYRCRGENSNGFGAWSSLLQTPSTPYTPSDLTISEYHVLDWINQSAVATGFQIYAAQNSAANEGSLHGTVQAPYETYATGIGSTAETVQFSFHVRAIVAGGGASAFIGPVWTHPLVATNLDVEQVSADTVQYSWTHAYQDALGSADTAEIECRVNGGGWTAVTSDSTLTLWSTHQGANSSVSIGETMEGRVRFAKGGKWGPWLASSPITWVAW